MPVALITGVNGQDGSYLAEFLLLKGYDVVGTTKGQNTDKGRILHILEKLEIVEADLLEQSLLENILRRYKPDEVYNLAARASSTELWTQPVLTGELNAIAVARLLDAIRTVDRKVRFIQASSSEVFGKATEAPQTETTPFHPRNPYGVAKAYGHWTTAIYREHHGLFACSTILYNHESPRRGLEFVTRKVSNTVARIKLGQAKELRLGNLDAMRDWGFAGDYVRAMWLILQQPTPDDYVVSTGEVHSVRELCEIAFSHVGLDYRDYVVQDCENFRLADRSLLVGNPAKAKRLLGWEPTVTFENLIRMMVDADLRAIQNISDPLTSFTSPRYQ
jgi:GDPmannose 4,6-dehydratase